MLYIASFAVLITGRLRADSGLVIEGGGCSPGDDPCFECFTCNEYGRCVPVDGCVPSCYSDDDCTRNQICNDNICELPGGAPKDDPNRSSGGSGGRRGSGTRSKGTGSTDRSGGHDTANPMGECQYDGSLGHNSDSQMYESECRHLSMAECMTTGPRGRCTYVPAEGSQIGCVWDGTGCSSGCIVGNMESRCGALTHDQAACEGYEGQQIRCKWSRAGAESMGSGMFDKVHLSNMYSKLSSQDILLIVLLTVSGIVGLYQLYRWCINWKLHREYKLVNTSDPTPRSSHCIIDGKAYF